MNNRPVENIQIQEHLTSKLADLYENEFIFDKVIFNLSVV